MRAEIGQKIKFERERKKVSQERLAKALGWNHHQIVSEVEQGNREIKAWELYEIAKFLHIDLKVLLGDQEIRQPPYVLWRQKPTHDEKLLQAQFVHECDNYVWIEQIVSSSQGLPSVVFRDLKKTKIDFHKFTLEHAYRFAEGMRGSMSLGDFPAAQLVGTLEDSYGVKFIVSVHDMEPSAACSRSDNGCFILINGRDQDSRQYFSIAHELFHLITWDQEMLELVEGNQRYHKKNEQLANAFAAGLLIPLEKLQIETARACGDRMIGAPDVIALAEQFHVSNEAMIYRMLNAALITKTQLEEIKGHLQRTLVLKIPTQPIARFLRSKYVRLVYLAYEHGKISRAKAAKLLNVDLCDLSDSFNEYGFVEVNAV